MRLGITAMGDEPIAEIAKAADAALSGLDPDSRGHLWIAEAYVSRDAIAQAAAALAITGELKVATGVVNLYTRHPALLLMSAATLEEQFPGRFVLGIGAGEKTWMQMLGLQAKRPMADLRAATSFFDAMRGEGGGSYAGNELSTGELRMPRILRSAVPTVIGTMGPKTIALAGNSAEGVMFSFDDGLRERLRENCEQFHDQPASGKEGSLGCVSQCFVTGSWMEDKPRDRVERLAEAMGSMGGPGPVVYDVDENGAAELVRELAAAGVSEVAFVAPAGAAESMGEFVARVGRAL
ncbi:MAG TPA: LLM class flavin-dependent oxidoreductase [Solirubrobacterales bacterium]|nr:LLM class flavin-dependent oxidoreductase [Solirubrobacterales bacterium]